MNHLLFADIQGWFDFHFHLSVTALELRGRSKRKSVTYLCLRLVDMAFMNSPGCDSTPPSSLQLFFSSHGRSR